jgi:hypothetical protein
MDLEGLGSVLLLKRQLHTWAASPFSPPSTWSGPRLSSSASPAQEGSRRPCPLAATRKHVACGVPPPAPVARARAAPMRTYACGCARAYDGLHVHVRACASAYSMKCSSLHVFTTQVGGRGQRVCSDALDRPSRALGKVGRGGRGGRRVAMGTTVSPRRGGRAEGACRALLFGHPLLPREIL